MLIIIGAMRTEEELQVANYFWKHGVVSVGLDTTEIEIIINDDDLSRHGG